MKLEGKIALITGASRGIGRGIAMELAREGAHIAVNYRHNAAAADATVHAIEELGSSAAAFKADVSEWAAVERMAGAVLAPLRTHRYRRRQLGHRRARRPGLESRRRSLAQGDQRQPARRLLHLPRHRRPSRRTPQRHGHSHFVDRRRRLRPLGAPYYVAKAGVNALTKSLAKECAPAGVRVNCIAPGLVATDMGDRMMKFYGEALLSTIPLGRAGQPEDIGKAAVYLASDDASFVTGKILRVDGGAWM